MWPIPRTRSPRSRTSEISMLICGEARRGSRRTSGARRRGRGRRVASPPISIGITAPPLDLGVELGEHGLDGPGDCTAPAPTASRGRSRRPSAPPYRCLARGHCLDPDEALDGPRRGLRSARARPAGRGRTGTRPRPRSPRRFEFERELERAVDGRRRDLEPVAAIEAAQRRRDRQQQRVEVGQAADAPAAGLPRRRAASRACSGAGGGLPRRGGSRAAGAPAR